MNLTQATANFEKSIVEAINESRLHPTVVRLVLLNLVNVVAEQERKLAEQETGGDADA